MPTSSTARHSSKSPLAAAFRSRTSQAIEYNERERSARRVQASAAMKLAMCARRSDVPRLSSCPALVRTPLRSGGGPLKAVRSAGASRLSNPASTSASAIRIAASGASRSTVAALPFAWSQFSASVESARVSFVPMPK
jgi:hypothetical protein